MESNGREQTFNDGIKNNDIQEDLDPLYIATWGADGTAGKIPRADLASTPGLQEILNENGAAYFDDARTIIVMAGPNPDSRLIDFIIGDSVTKTYYQQNSNSVRILVADEAGLNSSELKPTFENIVTTLIKAGVATTFRSPEGLPAGDYDYVATGGDQTIDGFKTFIKTLLAEQTAGLDYAAQFNSNDGVAVRIEGMGGMEVVSLTDTAINASSNSGSVFQGVNNSSNTTVETTNTGKGRAFSAISEATGDCAAYIQNTSGGSGLQLRAEGSGTSLDVENYSEGVGASITTQSGTGIRVLSDSGAGVTVETSTGPAAELYSSENTVLRLGTETSPILMLAEVAGLEKFRIDANGDAYSAENRLLSEADIIANNTPVTFDGVQTVFSIPHGLGVEPRSISITFGDASNTNFTQSVRTVDATNITLTCANPPLPGDQIVYWQVFK